MAKLFADLINPPALVKLAAYATATLLLAALPVHGETFDTCRPVTAKPGSFDERIFSIETPSGRIEGTIAAPADAVPKVLTLMLHGYTGARNENGGMFRRAARGFAERGIATLRIDFIGSGRSDGAWADTRFSTQARDAVRAAAAFRNEYDGKLPVSVLGYSQGGLVALRAAASDASVERMALWNPVMDPMATYGIIFGRDTIVEAARRYRRDGARDVVGKTRLRPGFFAEIVNADPVADAGHTKARILIVTGRRDPLVKNGAALAKRLADARSGDTTVLNLNAGHDLGALRDPPLLEHVIACTADFLLGEAN